MKIPLVVTFFHLLVIGALLYSHSPSPKTAPRRPVLVHTHVQQIQKKEEKHSQPAPKPIAAKPSKPPQKPKAAPPKPKQAPDPNRDKLISMMEESLQSLNTSTTHSKTPPAIGKLASEALSFETNYQEELINYLESLLTLPEKGDVKLKLTLHRRGSVEKVEITNATNERNRHYIETTLPTLILPPFGKHFKDQTTHTFNITLTSQNSR